MTEKEIKVDLGSSNRKIKGYISVDMDSVGVK